MIKYTTPTITLTIKGAEFLGFTLEHLKKLEPVVQRLDPKHEYEKIIYYSYIKNGGFYLTDEQRDEAYNVYLNGKRICKGVL